MPVTTGVLHPAGVLHLVRHVQKRTDNRATVAVTDVPNSGVSLIGQPGQGAERGDVMALHCDVTGLASGSQIGKPPRGGGSSGAGVSPRHDVASRDVAGQSTSARGGRRVSTGRQTELRAYLGQWQWWE
ncbi:hypothetical protein ACOMHN_025894 [Nucella lapillus]